MDAVFGVLLIAFLAFLPFGVLGYILWGDRNP